MVEGEGGEEGVRGMKENIRVKSILVNMAQRLPGCAAPLYVSLLSTFPSDVVKQQSLSSEVPRQRREGQ